MTKKEREEKLSKSKKSYIKDLKDAVLCRAKHKTVNNRFFTNEELIKECTKYSVNSTFLQSVLNKNNH